MKIVRNEERGTFTFTPDGKQDEAIIFHLRSLCSRTKMKYCGRKMEGDNLTGLEFEVGGFEFILSGTNQRDKQQVGCIRNACFHAGIGLIYIGNTDRGIVVTGTYCKVCKNPVIDMISCEHSVCNTCAQKCKHKYRKGIVHDGLTGDVGKGYFCKKCGRGSPRKTATLLANAY